MCDVFVLSNEDIEGLVKFLLCFPEKKLGGCVVMVTVLVIFGTFLDLNKVIVLY